MFALAFTSEIIKGRVILTDDRLESIESNDPAKLLGFLLEDYDDPDRKVRYIKVVWNLDEFIAPILRLLGKGYCEKLVGPSHKCFYRPFRIFYIPNKVLSIKMGRYRADIYGIDQYYPNSPDLKLVTDVAGYGNVLLQNLAKMRLYPTKLTSPASIYEQCVLGNMEVPTIDNVPMGKVEAAEYALQCCGRLWISAYQLGHFGEGECFDYDMTSAFPSIAKDLYSIKYCRFQKSTELVKGSHWGYLRGHLTMTAPIHPIMHLDDAGGLTNPVDGWDDYITLDDLRIIRKYKLGTFELKDGWFLRFTRNIQPFKEKLGRLYDMRKWSEDINVLAKGMANGGVYGKFLEQHADGSYGKYFNPFYGAQIATRVRLKVYEFIREHKLMDNIISIAVDGVLIDKKVELHEQDGMGSWRVNELSPALVISPGLVYYGEKSPKGLDYEMVVGLLKKHPSRSHYSIELEKRVTLEEALAREGKDFNKLGQWVSREQTLDLNTLKVDRVFDDLPRTGRDLLTKRYKSEPIKLSER